MANYIETQGTVLKRGNSASPEVFTAIPSVVSIDGPTATNEEIDTTHLGSTARESIGSLPDYGSMNLEVMWDERDATHAAMRTDFQNRTVRNYQVIDTGSPQKTGNFSGWIKTLPQSYNANDVVRGSIEIRLTGAFNVT